MSALVESPAALQLDLPLFDPPASPAPAPVAGGTARRILIDGQWIAYELVRARRRSIGFMIDDRGLRVSAPRWITLGQIESAVHEKSRWIVRKLIEWREHAQRRERLAVRWEAGGTVTHLGRALTLRPEPHARGVRLESRMSCRPGCKNRPARSSASGSPTGARSWACSPRAGNSLQPARDGAAAPPKARYASTGAWSTFPLRSSTT